MSIVTVMVPGPSGSRSKMQKKGWKCWAKVLSDVKEPANTGYDYEGELLSVGSRHEVELGSVILHIDQSSNNGVGVVMPKAGAEDRGVIKWRKTTCAARWAGDLARDARRLLKMTPEERVLDTARRLAANQDLADEERAHYAAIVARMTPTAAAEAPVEDPVTDVSIDAREQAIAEIRRLMKVLHITVAEIA